MLKDNIVYTIMSVIERSAGLLLLPVYTAYLSPSDFGAISLITLIITVASSLSISPLKIALRRFYISFGDRKREYLFLAMTCMVLNLILFAPILYVFSKYYALSILNNIELVNLIRLFIIVYIFNSISQLLFQIFILERMAILATKINSIKAIFLLVTTSLFFILDFGIYSIPYGLIISQLCMIVLFSKHIKGKMVVNTNYKLLIEPLKYGYSLLISSISSTLFQLGDRFIIQFIMGVSSVGIYSFSYGLSGISNVLVATPNKLAMQPVILARESNPENVNSLLNRYSCLFFTLGMIIVLWISVFSKELILLISQNSEFEEGWVIIPVISLSYLLHGLGLYYGFGLVMLKDTRIVTFQSIIAVMINIVLNILFIPVIGILGASVATLISYMIWNFLKRTYSEKKYSSTFQLGKLRQVLLIGLATILLLYLVEYYKFPILAKLILVSISSIGLYHYFLTNDDRRKLRVKLKDIVSF